MILSILIPTYNRPKQLLIAIKSCLDLKTGNVEIIIGDDSPQLLKKDFFDQINIPHNYNLRYLHRSKALKQNKNVNNLIHEATGKYSLILHDDDYLLPNSLQKLINEAEYNNDLNCIYFGKQILVNDLNQSIESNRLNKEYFRTNEFKGFQSNPVKMAILQQVPSNSFLFPTLYGKKIGYRKYEKVGDACDFDFVLRFVLLENSNLFFINDYISAYRLSNQSVSRSNNYNSIYYKYEIIKELKINQTHPLIYKQIIETDLNVLCGYYINNNRRQDLRKLYFSKYYSFKRKCSLRGIYHLVNCLSIKTLI